MTKTVVITGASRGIGLSAAKLVAAEGNRVFATMRDPRGRNAEAASSLVKWAIQANADLSIVDLDVTDEASVRDAIQSIEAEHPIDVLVNNAGVMPVGLTEAFSLDELRTCMDVNLYGIVRTTAAVLPGMRTRRAGTLIHLSSIAGRLSMPFFGVYCASKWAMEAYCETLQYEVEGFGIQSVIVEPGGHSTDLVKTSPRPKNTDLEAEYGQLGSGGDRMLGMFEAMFAEGEQITDAGNVAKTIASLVRSEDKIPMRVCVGTDLGVSGINQNIAPFQAGVIEQLKPVYSGAADG